MSNILLGSDGISIRQGIYEQKADQKTDLGRFVEFQDGRKFRYCKSAGGTVKALMTQGPGVTVGEANFVQQVGYGLSVGDKDNLSILLTSAPDANEYADGFLIVAAGATQGEGQIYKIRKSTAAYAPCKIWLYDKIKTAIAAGAYITLMKSKYLDVVTCPAKGSMTGMPVGVPLITITDNYYFWAQTKGYCPMRIDSTVTVGDPVGPGNTDAGYCEPIAAFTDPIYGIAVYVASAENYGIIDLQLE